MTERACHAYRLLGPPEALRSAAERLGPRLVHWVAEAHSLAMGQGVPQDWKEQGAVFGPAGELRWWRDGQSYLALLLAEEPLTGLEGLPGLEPLSGEWTTDEEPVPLLLHDLQAPQLRPGFLQYPHGKGQGKLMARVYRRDGVVVFVSPRRLEE